METTMSQKNTTFQASTNAGALNTLMSTVKSTKAAEPLEMTLKKPVTTVGEPS